MAFLANSKKEDLVNLAAEMNCEVESGMRKIELIKLIESSEDYEVDLVKGLIAEIMETRKERELAQQKREKELADREERLDQQKREFELAKFRITRENPQESRSPSPPRVSGHALKHIMQKFDPEETDISLYLCLFERQAQHLKLPEAEWSGSLISLLPFSVAAIVLREKVEDTQNYSHVKNVLLERFRLSPEAFRQKFVRHQRKPGNLWKDYLFEIRTYFEGWIEGLGITTFESLKDLFLVDQLKRKMGSEIREQRLGDWENYTSPETLVKDADRFELIRKTSRPPNPTKKFEGRAPDQRKLFGAVKTGENYEKPPEKHQPERKLDKVSSPRPKETYRKEWNHKEFDKKRVSEITCFQCHEVGHIRPNCPLLKKKEEVNSIGAEIEITDPLKPYVSIGTVNGQVCEILRDSGSTVDLVCRKFISPDDYLGETVWLTQPLDTHAINVPLARVVLNSQYGDIITKACVISDHSNQQRYILGNQTAALLKQGKQPLKRIEINAVTRLQLKSQENPKQVLEQIEGPPKCSENCSAEGESIILTPLDGEGQTSFSELPPLDQEGAELSLLSVSTENFVDEQRKCSEVAELLKRVENSSQTGEKGYIMMNGLLCKQQRDHFGGIRNLLVVPKVFREKLLAVCHESTNAHLGATKSKQRLAKSYFWPRCYQEMEEYVRSCDACQRIGNAQDTKRFPMRLTPIISEPFVKINIDACGPLPESENGNKFLITAICLASKFPEAIPVKNLRSLSVTDALLQVFSRTGFPREVQCDNGTSFTSELTCEFFEKFNIKVTHSSVGHPQSNPVERFHRTLKRLLKILCLETGESWERHLPASLLAIRTITHSSTGFSPAELLYGKNLRTPEVLLYEGWMGSCEEERPVTEHVLTLVNRLKRARELAAQKMGEEQIKRKEAYDKSAVKRHFEVGDLVLIFSLARPNKFAPKWVGPGKIEARISETNYRVQTPGPRQKSSIYHINMLKPYIRRPETINWVYEGKVGIGTEDDFEIHVFETGATDFDYQEIVRESELDARLNLTQQGELRKLLCRHASIFSNNPGKTEKVTHDIELISDKVVRSRPYKTSHRQNEILKLEIDKMLKLGVIEVGESDYTSPIILVETDGREPRPCIDYRRLNEIIRTEYYPLPNIEERVEQVAGSDFITILDLAKGYWQIPLTERAQRIAAFVTSFGTFRPLRMPFGLKNAPFFFSKLMADVLNGCEEYAVPYIDDIAIFSKTWDEHLKHLDVVLSRVAQAQLTIKSSKCRFAQNHVKYLGHMVGGGYRNPAELKVKCIREFPRPETKTSIRAFLGLAGYYAHYIPNYSLIAAPLTDALKGREKRAAVKWDEACEAAFTTLKNALIQTPVLRAPDFSVPFVVQTDASDLGAGVVLAQQIGDKEHPILYLSRKFSEPEKKYSTTEKECLAIIFALKKLHYYLDGSEFKIVTDHNPLVWLKKNASSNSRLFRWQLMLQQFCFRVEHKPGRQNTNADALSRCIP